MSITVRRRLAGLVALLAVGLGACAVVPAGNGPAAPSRVAVADGTTTSAPAGPAPSTVAPKNTIWG